MTGPSRAGVPAAIREPRARPLRVCLAGTWDPDFSRNQILLRLLALAGCEISVCRSELWGERADAVVRRGKLGLALRAPGAYARLAWRFVRAERPDVVLVPYPGHFDMPLLAPLARARGLPLVFDAFLSLYDTVVADRGLLDARSAGGRALRAVDALACRAADLVLADTPAHADYLAELSGVPRERFRVLWVGAREEVFRPLAGVEPDPSLVLFYGTFIPLHGLETIVRAAAALEPDGFRVRIIGRGQESERIDRLAAELGARNLERVPSVPLEALPGEIARAGVCLGIFGTTGKADRVLPNKLFECLAVGRPVVTGDTTAVRASFGPGELVTVAPGDPVALAAAIRALRADPAARERVAAAGHARFQRDFGERVLARLLRGHLEELVAR